MANFNEYIIEELFPAANNISVRVTEDRDIVGWYLTNYPDLIVCFGVDYDDAMDVAYEVAKEHTDGTALVCIAYDAADTDYKYVVIADDGQLYRNRSLSYQDNLF